MNLLVISPDYTSHYLPMAAVALAARRRGISVTIATGTSLRQRVEADRFDWRPLRLAAGANPGRLDRRDPDTAAADDLAPFFAATRDGMVAVLRQQAERRRDDLLWQPREVVESVRSIVDEVAPDAVLVDHLAFAATLALRAIGRPFTTFVAGHPSQLPGPGEVYGYPVAWPRCIAADTHELAALRAFCETVTARCTDRYNEVLGEVAPDCPPVADMFAAHGAHVLFNSPELLLDPRRSCALPPSRTFLGATRRIELADAPTRAWLAGTAADGFVYASLGTFLSARVDVLRRVVDGLRRVGRPVAMATGTTDPAVLGDLPVTWLVAPELRQVALLGGATAVVTHGGNNTVTEALAGGCPMVVLPLSTDQFANAADLERVGLGTALDPNTASGRAIADAVAWALAPEAHRRASTVAAALAAEPGPDLAVDSLVADYGGWRAPVSAAT